MGGFDVEQERFERGVAALEQGSGEKQKVVNMSEKGGMETSEKDLKGFSL